MTQIFKCDACNKLFLTLGKEKAPGGNGFVELPANSTDAATEKHVPEVEFNNGGITVRIGSVLHPMLPEHHIEWVLVETVNGGLFHYFSPGDTPEVTFPSVDKAQVLAVYEYCNLHGLWKKDV